jgi:hypothetical protein
MIASFPIFLKTCADRDADGGLERKYRERSQQRARRVPEARVTHQAVYHGDGTEHMTAVNLVGWSCILLLTRIPPGAIASCTRTFGL